MITNGNYAEKAVQIDACQADHDQELVIAHFELVIVAELVVLELEKDQHSNQERQTNENEFGDVAHFHGQIVNFVLVNEVDYQRDDCEQQHEYAHKEATR